MKGHEMQDKVKGYNESQMEQRKDLPNLVEIIKLAKQGNRKTVDLYFYGYKEVENHSYDGKKQMYEVTKVKFFDKPLDIWLGHMKRRYTKATSVGEMSGFEGRKVSYKVNVSNFEESEIDMLWYEWFYNFCDKIKLENFEKESEGKTLNAIRKYIRMGFQNHLKKVNNEKIGLERVRVDGKLYYVKNKQEEVFFDDIYIGQDDDGENLNFIDIVKDKSETNPFALSDITFTTKDFIEDNMEQVLTKKQYEKWLLLLEYVEEFGIEQILDKYTGKIKKAAVQRIIYPDQTFKNTERVDSIVTIMNKRIEKALDKAGISYVSIEEENAKENEDKNSKNGEVITYTGGFTQEEVDRYFEQHVEGIFRASMERRLTWVKGTDAMLPSLENMNELPFDVYERWVNGGKQTRIEIIKEYYNRDKFKMKAGKKENVKVIPPTKQEEKNDKYIEPAQLKEIRKNSSLNK